jgi:hypothetical protein
MTQFTGDLLRRREHRRSVQALTARDNLARTVRQITRYGRAYRRGLHARIEEMKQHMALVAAKKEDFRRYKSFVDQIEHELKQHVPSVTRSRDAPDQLTAGMIRRDIARALSAAPSESKTHAATDSPVDTMLQTETEPIRIDKHALGSPEAEKQVGRDQPVQQGATPERSRPDDRQNWFIPASQETEALQRSIEATIGRQHHEAREGPQKTATYSEVREKVRREAENKRAHVPPAYRGEGYDRRRDEARQSRGTAARSTFRRATGGADQPKTEQSRMPTVFNMQSGANETQQAASRRDPNAKPKADI